MSKLFLKRLCSFFAVLCLGSGLYAQDADTKLYKSLLVKNAVRLGITPAEATEAVITSAYTDANSQLTYVYLQQTYRHIRVYNTLISAAFRNGSLVSASGHFVPAIAAKAGNATPLRSHLEAVADAARHLGLPETTAPRTVADLFEAEQKYIVSPAGLAEQDIAVTLFWTPSADRQQVTLTWNVNIDLLHSDDWWNVRTDAATGAFVQQDNWTVHEHPQQPTSNHTATARPGRPAPHNGSRTGGTQTVLQSPPPNVASATYQVIPFPLESPNHGAFASTVSPWNMAGAGNNATTLGWHFDSVSNYTITRGNNVFAFLDRRNNNLPDATINWPDTSTTPAPALTFVHHFSTAVQPFGSVENKKAALDNLFYWNNLMHDVTYQYGFTEAAGNFQRDNLGRGGNGNDFVHANALDSAGYNNANFSTPPDGGSGRMQMFTWITPSTFNVNSPATIAGAYSSIESNFSTANKLINRGPVTGEVVFYNDDLTGLNHLACGTAGAPANPILGKIALIYRGVCGFTEKVKNAQTAGAIGVIMVNNVAGAPFTMSGTDNSIVIPAMMISQADGALITAQMENGVTATLSAGIYKDGDFDNGIICHEYGHGISSRLTGGPANSSCLTNAEQGGEGWSDYMALMMTTNWNTATLADGATARTIGSYAVNEPVNGFGLRRYPYSTNMLVSPLTYANVATNTQVHAIGEIWCATLWDMTWNIIQQQGSITANLYNSAGTGGNAIAMNLVITGMKLQPCGPGFLDARDAILRADSLLYNYAHKCAIWNAFARRGMGFSASQGLSTSASDQTPAFDLPAGVQVAQPSPLIVSVNAQTTITHSATCNCQPVSGYQLRDTIPAGFTYVSSTPAGTLNGNVLSFPATSFAATETRNFSITLRAPAAGCIVDSVINDNRESSTTGGFTPSGTALWVPSSTRSHTPTLSWYTPEPSTVTSTFLTSSPIATAPASAGQNLSILSFWHLFNTESSYDGGVVEYSTNGGTTWNDAGPLFMRGGYNAGMDASTALAGRRAYTGTNVSFTPAYLNLAALGNTPVAFRFRMETDNGTGGDGWYVDDIARVNGCGGFLKTGVYNAAGTRQDSLLQPVFVTPTVLPVTLLWFYANQLGTQVALDWKTVSEVNARDFSIEWSTDGSNWTPVGQTAAQNRSNNSYYFLHNHPASGKNYYRIRMNDLDGKFTYSPVRIIQLQSKGKPEMVLLPNPVRTEAVLYLSREVKAQTIRIYDAAGSLVRQLPAGIDVQQVKIPTANLAAGIYTIEATGNGRYITRMLVQH